MKMLFAGSIAVAAVTVALGVPIVTVAQSSSPSPKPKISISPKTLRAAKYKQDTMIKRSERHPEATGGNTASGENPSNHGPQPSPSPH